MKIGIALLCIMMNNDEISYLVLFLWVQQVYHGNFVEDSQACEINNGDTVCTQMEMLVVLFLEQVNRFQVHCLKS